MEIQIQEQRLQIQESWRDICSNAYLRVINNDCKGIRELFENKPAETLFTGLTSDSDQTIIHIAAKRSLEVLQVVISMIPREKIVKALQTKNLFGNTALHKVALVGNVKAAECLIAAASAAVKELVEGKNNVGETPLYLAAVSGKMKMTQYLVAVVLWHGIDLRVHYTRNDTVSILHAAVIDEHFDVAVQLLSVDENLANYKNKSGETCLHVLANMSSALERTTCQKFVMLLVELAKMLVKHDQSWLDTRQRDWSSSGICVEQETMRTSISGSSNSPVEMPLFIAARRGILMLLQEILNVHPYAIDLVNEEGQNALHMAVIHRQYHIFSYLKEFEAMRTELATMIDRHGCTILHHAALTKYSAGGPKRTAVLKLQDEWAWFKEVKALVLKTYPKKLNEDNLKAEELFERTHEAQYREAKQWVKETSQACISAAALTFGVVFAALSTTPGGSNSNGLPIFLNVTAHEIYFVLIMWAVLMSMTSLAIFLHLLLSPLELTAFESKVPRLLLYGIVCLFGCIGANLMAFLAIIYLIFKIDKWWKMGLIHASALLPGFGYIYLLIPLILDFLVGQLRRLKNCFRELAGVARKRVAGCYVRKFLIAEKAATS